MSNIGRNDYLQSLAKPHAIVGAAGPGGAPAGGGGVPAPGSAGAGILGPDGAFLAVQAWWQFKYASAQAWYAKNFAFNLAAGSVNQVVTGCTFQVPQNCKMVLKQFIMNIIAPTTATDVTLTLRRNQAPIPGWTAVAFLPFPLAAEALPWNGVDEVFDEGDVFDVVFNNNNGATAWVVGVQASGWFVQKQDIDRLQGGVRY